MLFTDVQLIEPESVRCRNGNVPALQGRKCVESELRLEILVADCFAADYTLTSLEPGYVYIGPTVFHANTCQCNTVYYSMLSACGLCQDRDYIR